MKETNPQFIDVLGEEKLKDIVSTRAYRGADDPDPKYIAHFNPKYQKQLLKYIQKLKGIIEKQNAQDDELLAKVKDYVNADHPLVVDMEDGTGRTGVYIETGFLRSLLERLEKAEQSLENAQDAFENIELRNEN